VALRYACLPRGVTPHLGSVRFLPFLPRPAAFAFNVQRTFHALGSSWTVVRYILPLSLASPSSVRDAATATSARRLPTPYCLQSGTPFTTRRRRVPVILILLNCGHGVLELCATLNWTSTRTILPVVHPLRHGYSTRVRLLTAQRMRTLFSFWTLQHTPPSCCPRFTAAGCVRCRARFPRTGGTDICLPQRPAATAPMPLHAETLHHRVAHLILHNCIY